jgi:hypothetical protein
MSKPRTQHIKRTDKSMKRNEKNIIKSATYAILAMFFGLAAPLLAAKDAVTIDTSEMDIAAAVAAAIGAVEVRREP